MVPVFVYQTLLDKKIREKVLGRNPNAYPHTLCNYKNQNLGDGYHTISYSSGDFIKGEIIYITLPELKKLDDWESHYRRSEIRLSDDDPAYVYIYNLQGDGRT